MNTNMTPNEFAKMEKFQQFRKGMVKNNQELFTRGRLIEMSIKHRFVSSNVSDYVMHRAMDVYGKMPETKFVRTMRNELKLYVCIFAPDRYYIKYN